MKTLKNSILILVAISLFFVFGCEKNPASPEEQNDELSDAEKMLIVAAEVSGANGGLMADLEMAEATATGQTGSLQKVVSFDTTITIEWITYALQLKFYAENGNEQPVYIENRTDKIQYESSLSGNHTIDGTDQTITLKRNSSFEITDIISDTIEINGTSWNNSEYLLEYNNVKLTVDPSGAIALKNLKIDASSDTYIPYAGKIEANIKGSFKKDGIFNQNEAEYDFDCTVEFTGDATVIVTLPSGAQYKLNLLTGDFSKVS